jgi:hypothetical protein
VQDVNKPSVEEITEQLRNLRKRGRITRGNERQQAVLRKQLKILKQKDK